MQFSATECEYPRINANKRDFVRFRVSTAVIANNRVQANGKMCVVGPQALLVVSQHRTYSRGLDVYLLCEAYGRYRT